jgi:class 3 adenylate cyclase/tetratricopeptide (TPR) repeat protein
MDCRACGHENVAGAKFCSECGAPLASCSGCGTQLQRGAKFCPECGAPVGQSTPFSAGTKAPDIPPTPPHLAESIRRSRAALQGEHKQLTVLFADVQRSMDLQEGRDPEEWARLMDRLVHILAEAIHRFEGTIEKFTGDGVMALFGAPVAHEDHARRACYAALHMLDAVASFAHELRKSEGLNFSMRVGLNSGEVVVGAIGDDLRMKYTAVGHTVGLAQRIEALAEPGTAYLTEYTAALVAGYFRLRDLGKFDIKGSRDPIGVLALEGVGTLRTSYEVAQSRGLSRMVGRRDEMAALNAALEQALQGNTQVVGVVGEAGVGKSRLCEEFAHMCEERGLTVRRAHGVSYGKAIPMLPVLQLLRNYFEIAPEDPAQKAREKVAGRLVLLDPAFEEDLPLMFDFLEVPDPARSVPSMAPEAYMRRVYAVLRRLIERRSAQEPIVVLLEDLHWLDPQSEDFIEWLIESYPGTRTLALANFRPEFHAPWMRHSYYQQIALRPLAPNDVDELLTELVGTDESLAAIREPVLQRTGGNPFFVEEVARVLIDDGTLEGIPGNYRLARPLDQVRVPPTVQAVLAARIDRLGERDKDALQTAAVIGREFREPVLQHVCERPDHDLVSALRSLCASEFLQQESLYPVAEYRFWHPLTQEVALASLLSERRAALHGAVARALIELEPERHLELARLIAHHFEEADEPLEAAQWNARTAEGLSPRDAAAALERWRRVLELAEVLPESGEALTLRLSALAQLLRMGGRTGMPSDEAQRAYRAGRTLALRSGDRASLVRLDFGYGAYSLFATAELNQGFQRMASAVRGADELSNRSLAVAARVGTGRIALDIGPLSVTIDAADRAIELAAGDLSCGAELTGYSPFARHLAQRSAALAFAGDLGRSREDGERALAIARQRGETEVVVVASNALHLHAFFSGEPGNGVMLAREVLKLADEAVAGYVPSSARLGLGIACIAAGRLPEAVDVLEDGLRKARSSSVLAEECSLMTYLAWAHQAAGNGEAALQVANGAMELIARRGARVMECALLVARAGAYRLSGPGASRHKAHNDLMAAHELIEAVGARALLPFLHAELAEQALAAGDGATAQRERREAERLFAAIGATAHTARMAFWS